MDITTDADVAHHYRRGTIELAYLGPLVLEAGSPCGVRLRTAEGADVLVSGWPDDPHVAIDDAPHWESEHRFVSGPVSSLVRAAADVYREVLAERTGAPASETRPVAVAA